LAVEFFEAVKEGNLEELKGMHYIDRFLLFEYD